DRGELERDRTPFLDRPNPGQDDLSRPHVAALRGLYDLLERGLAIALGHLVEEQARGVAGSLGTSWTAGTTGLEEAAAFRTVGLSVVFGQVCHGLPFLRYGICSTLSANVSRSGLEPFDVSEQAFFPARRAAAAMRRHSRCEPFTFGAFRVIPRQVGRVCHCIGSQDGTPEAAVRRDAGRLSLDRGESALSASCRSAFRSGRAGVCGSSRIAWRFRFGQLRMLRRDEYVNIPAA